MNLVFDSYGDFDITVLYVGEAHPPHALDRFLAIAELLAPFFGAKGTVMRARVFDRERWLAPRVRWSPQSFPAWCTGREGSHRFMSVKAQRPSWTVCAKQRRMPDAYFEMGRDNPQRGKIAEYWLMLAVQREIGLPEPLPIMRSVAALLSPIALYAIRGPFAEPGLKRKGARGEGMSNALSDVGVPTGKAWTRRKLRF